MLMGNCGFTITPCRPEHREQTLKNLTQVEGMSLDALLTGTATGYQSFAEHLGLLEWQGVVPNVVVYCGHSSVRMWVMGEDAIRRTASAAEVAGMQAVLREALAAGAVGFATSTFQGHNGWGATPIPSRFADETEMRALVGTLGEVGRSCFMLTKGRHTSIEFLESLAADSGRPVAVAAIQYDRANPTRAFDDIQAIGAAVARGRRMAGQVACTPISMDFTLTSAYLFESMATWKPAIALYQDAPALAALYRDPGFRSAVRDELIAPGALNRFTDQWELVKILRVARAEHRHLEGRMVADLAGAEQQHPLDGLLDFGIAEDFQTLFNAQILNADETQVLKFLKDPKAPSVWPTPVRSCSCSATPTSACSCSGAGCASAATSASRRQPPR